MLIYCMRKVNKQKPQSLKNQYEEIFYSQCSRYRCSSNVKL